MLSRGATLHSATPSRPRSNAAISVRHRPVLAIATMLLVFVAASGLPNSPVAHDSAVITGPYASLLAASRDLGPSQPVMLSSPSRCPLPTAHTLFGWADTAWDSRCDGDLDSRGRSSKARPGPRTGFRRTRTRLPGSKGQVFYASSQQPSLPAPLRDDVTGVGRDPGIQPASSGQAVDLSRSTCPGRG